MIENYYEKLVSELEMIPHYTYLAELQLFDAEKDFETTEIKLKNLEAEKYILVCYMQDDNGKPKYPNAESRSHGLNLSKEGDKEYQALLSEWWLKRHTVNEIKAVINKYYNEQKIKIEFVRYLTSSNKR